MEGKALGRSFPLPSCIKRMAYHSWWMVSSPTMRKGDGSSWNTYADVFWVRFKWCNVQMVWRPCRRILQSRRVRWWPKPLISNKSDMMLDMHSSCFTLITWLKLAELLWDFTSVKLCENISKKKKTLKTVPQLTFPSRFFRYANSICMFLWNAEMNTANE